MRHGPYHRDLLRGRVPPGRAVLEGGGGVADHVEEEREERRRADAARHDHDALEVRRVDGEAARRPADAAAALEGVDALGLHGLEHRVGPGARAHALHVDSVRRVAGPVRARDAVGVEGEAGKGPGARHAGQGNPDVLAGLVGHGGPGGDGELHYAARQRRGRLHLALAHELHVEPSAHVYVEEARRCREPGEVENAGVEEGKHHAREEHEVGQVELAPEVPAEVLERGEDGDGEADEGNDAEGRIDLRDAQWVADLSKRNAIACAFLDADRHAYHVRKNDSVKCPSMNLHKMTHHAM